MRILYLDAFHTGSHAAIARGYAAHSGHDIQLLTLSGAGGWRWRMRGAAVTLARQLREQWRGPHDLTLATDMLDLATFCGLTRDLTAGIPLAVYMHENQLTYPLPAGRERDLAFAWTNYTSMLCADAVLCNSAYHRNALLGALPGLIGRYHDHQERDLVDTIALKTQVLYPGITSDWLDAPAPARDDGPPVVLWNSRWEYDKGPDVFFAACDAAAAAGIAFRLVVLGEPVNPRDALFAAARERHAQRALVWGFVPDITDYYHWLRRADIVVSAAQHEFFGIAVLEAIAAGCQPLLPNRLSYPELIPAAWHASCLYADDTHLAGALCAALTNANPPARTTIATLAAPYTWPRAAAHWDAALVMLGAHSRRA